jgi:sugar/nucleoside kinase (ribokinase family)
LADSAPDFVAVGHLTLDLTERGTRPGGAALYAALTAHRLGLSVGLLTSFGPDFPPEVLPGEIQLVNLSSTRTTTFRHQAGDAGRCLTLLDRAADLEVGHLPEEWKSAGLALLCPVINEVDPYLAAEFAEGAVGAGCQGWMRERGKDGVVSPAMWEDAPLVLPHVQAVFLGWEDAGPFEDEIFQWFQQLPLGVITLGPRGALLFVNGERYEVGAEPADEVDAIGAGDVFAAAFLVRYQQEGDPWDAAGFAACAAALRVEHDGLAAIPSRAQVEERLAVYRRRLGG